MSAPTFRANYTKHSIGHIKRLPEPDRSRLLDQIGNERDELRKASIFDWVDGPLHVAVADAVASGLGPARALEFWRDVMLDAFSRSLLRPIVRGAIAIHGDSPASVLSMSPRAWSLVAKDAGEITVSAEDERHAVITFRELPALLAASPGMLAFFEGAITAVGVYLETPLSVQRDASEIETGVLHLSVEWD